MLEGLPALLAGKIHPRTIKEVEVFLKPGNP